MIHMCLQISEDSFVALEEVSIFSSFYVKVVDFLYVLFLLFHPNKQNIIYILVSLIL